MSDVSCQMIVGCRDLVTETPRTWHLDLGCLVTDTWPLTPGIWNLESDIYSCNAISAQIGQWSETPNGLATPQLLILTS